MAQFSGSRPHGRWVPAFRQPLCSHNYLCVETSCKFKDHVWRVLVHNAVKGNKLIFLLKGHLLFNTNMNRQSWLWVPWPPSVCVCLHNIVHLQFWNVTKVWEELVPDIRYVWLRTQGYWNPALGAANVEESVSQHFYFSCHFVCTLRMKVCTKNFFSW